MLVVLFLSVSGEIERTKTRRGKPHTPREEVKDTIIFVKNSEGGQGDDLVGKGTRRQA